jgi:hypothetical protein
MGKVTHEVAEKEVLKWLDFKKVDDEKRNEQESSIKTIQNAIVAGILILDEKLNFVYTLKWPLEDSEGNEVLNKLTFKPRMKTSEADSRLKNLKDPSNFEMIRCFTAALTSESMGLLKDLDSEDTRVAHAISAFFL